VGGVVRRPFRGRLSKPGGKTPGDDRRFPRRRRRPREPLFFPFRAGRGVRRFRRVIDGGGDAVVFFTGRILVVHRDDDGRGSLLFYRLDDGLERIPIFPFRLSRDAAVLRDDVEEVVVLCVPSVVEKGMRASFAAAPGEDPPAAHRTKDGVVVEVIGNRKMDMVLQIVVLLREIGSPSRL